MISLRSIKLHQIVIPRIHAVEALPFQGQWDERPKVATTVLE